MQGLIQGAAVVNTIDVVEKFRGIWVVPIVLRRGFLRCMDDKRLAHEECHPLDERHS